MSKKSKRHEPRVPLTAAGGIRSQARRNQASRPWWGRRWLLVFEAMNPGARLGRGRSYAVSGQVTRLAFSTGVIEATVQGGRPRPYEVALRFATLPDAAAKRLSTKLAGSPLLIARLLVGELPHRIETWFEEEGAPLFPRIGNDMSTDCDCPDWSSTCKHVAAAYLLFGEAMEQNPALLLRLRGLTLPELEFEPDLTAETAERDHHSDWDGIPPTPMIDPKDSATGAAGESAPLVRRLGPLPFWRGIDRFEETMACVCQRAMPAGWRAWTSEREPPPAALNAIHEITPRRAPLRTEIF